MLLTITTTAEPATDLGFLLHKHPERVQSFAVTGGTAHVCYPRADPQRCTAALLLEVDPIGLVRRRSTEDFGLGQYVNDRPYAASSLLAVALGKVFRTALAGRCDARPELAATPLPLQIELPATPGGAELITGLFEPLGWAVQVSTGPLDPAFPDWGESPYCAVTLTGRMRLAEALNHLYVLLPVLDDGKHYWVSPDEVDKLIRAGAGWLSDHPQRALISHRYLAHQRPLTDAALARLAELDDAATFEPAGNEVLAAEPSPEPLAVQRRAAVRQALRAAGAARVVDLGCGSGALLVELLADPAFTEVVGADVSHRALQAAQRRTDRLPERTRARLRLWQSALTYTDDRLAGFDALVLMEVIEHLDPPRLPALERTVFAAAHPATVVMTTPNADYNVRYPGLAAGAFRHPDHRFEWTRAQFADWARRVAAERGYTVTFDAVGPSDPQLGGSTQLAVFTAVAA